MILFGTNMLKRGFSTANDLVVKARLAAGTNASASTVWSILHRKELSPSLPFEVHKALYEEVYDETDDSLKPAWIPSTDIVEKTNIFKTMKQKGFSTYDQFYKWSIDPKSRDDFWLSSTENIKIDWKKKPSAAFDLAHRGSAHTHATYFPEGRLNIIDSCFNKTDPFEPAIIYSSEIDGRNLRQLSYKTLNSLSNKIANGITQKLGVQVGDAIGICMPMTPEAVAIYIGIVKAGCVVVSIADSFSSEEIAARCKLAGAKTIFTQDVIYRDRGKKFLPLLDRVLGADQIVLRSQEEKTTECSSMRIVILPGNLHANCYPDVPVDKDGSTWTDKDSDGEEVPFHESILTSMRNNHDVSWYELLRHSSDEFRSVQVSAMDPCNILFSSGTTSEPKAIVWSHSTPIKSAIDGYYHMDIQVGNRVAWPTNIGWMMGPWLIFQLINGATIGLFNGIASKESFCEFIDEAEISMLGVIPSLVKSWQSSDATKNCDWSKIQKFSSTGEVSDPVTSLWLMSRVPGYAPVIEYCGGTEIGGSFLSSTMVHDNVPSMFSTPALGSKFLIQDTEGKLVDGSEFEKKKDGKNGGEILLSPPTVGLSTTLLNKDHFSVYYKGMPRGPDGELLRKHGDEIEFVRNSLHLPIERKNSMTPYFRALGRSDDTMNIGGIKTSNIEIESVCNLAVDAKETAAIAVSGTNGRGPARLVIYIVRNQGSMVDKEFLKSTMQKLIKTKLNPLFGINDVVLTDSLPRTASNKIMRRVLRDNYLANIE